MNNEIRQRILTELGGRQKNFLVQIESSYENYNEITDYLVDFLMHSSKSKGIYVTLNKPYSVLVDYLKKRQVDIGRFFFIDAISGNVQEQQEENDSFVIIPGPTSLTELSVQISKAHDLKGMDFVFFDSFSTLLIYNSVQRSLQYAHFLMNKLKDYGFFGVVVFVKSDLERNLFDSVAHLSDKSLKF